MYESTILSSEKLNLYYGAAHALKDVDIDIPERQVTALIGPSGCGKSTFLKTLDRMNDLVPGVTHRGDCLLPGAGHLRPLRGCDLAAQADRHGLPEAQPLPHVHL